jgi:acyl-CoA synthetase (AMP-forming)/AMP-acid ligase II
VAAATLDELGELADRHRTDPVEGGPLAEDDPHVVFFTSGSTGRPKGAILSHRSNHLRSNPGALPEPRGPMVCPYPLFHMGAWTIALQQWQARDAVVLLESAGAEEICAAVERHGATRLNAVPAVWQRIIDHAGPTGPARLATLRFADTGTSATPPELLAAIGGMLPDAQLRVFYGSTEAGGVTCLEHRDIRRKPGSCGVAVPGVRVRRDGSGELWVRSPFLFDGYLDDPDATAGCLVDGWYRTGDVADRDGDGFFRIVGRTGDLVRSGGETVLPAEVEAVLAAHPSVDQVAVVGLPDPAWGEVVCAVVVVAPGRTAPTVAELRELCDGRLAAFKHPREVRLVDALPRTPSTGQVQRRLLVDRFRED